MKKLFNKIKNNLSKKEGASNLEVIIVMVVALVIGAALFLFGGVLRDTANGGKKRADSMNATMSSNKTEMTI